MKNQEGTFCASGGLELFYQCWLPDDAAQAGMILVHGAGDHTGRYARLVAPLVERSIAVYGCDLRGYGRSPGRKGHINSWDEYRQDVQAFIRQIGEWQAGLPLFLFGYSLGAMIVLDSILRQPDGVRGAILSGTPIDPVGVASPSKKLLAKAMSRVWPSFTVKLENDIKGVSRDPAVIEELQNDPLHHNFATARWGTEAMDISDWVRRRPGEIRVPVLFIHGEADPFNTVTGVQKYFEQISFGDKTLKVYPGSRHETHNDLDHTQVAADIADWILARV